MFLAPPPQEIVLLHVLIVPSATSLELERRPFPVPSPVSTGCRVLLQQSSRPDVSRYGVDRDPLHRVAREGRGVNGGAVAHGYSDVGYNATALLAPADQIQALGSPGPGCLWVIPRVALF